MTAVSKQEADAHDRLIDAAADLASLIEAGGIVIDEAILERLTLYLAQHAGEVRRILSHGRPRQPSPR